MYLAILALPMFSHMLYDFFQKGMIFEFYGNWLFREDYENDEIKYKIEGLKLELSESIEMSVHRAHLSDQILMLENSIKPTPFYKKPLGNCLKCFHVWICIIFTIIFSLRYHLDFNLFKWVLSVSISYYILIKNHYE